MNTPAQKIMKSAYGQYNFSNYPIIVFKPDSGYPTLDDVKDSLKKFKAVINNTSGKFVVVLDTSLVNWIGEEPRQLLAVGFQNIEKDNDDRYMLTIFYSQRFMLRILLKITTTIIPPHVRQVVYSNLDKAMKRAELEVSKF